MVKTPKESVSSYFREFRNDRTRNSGNFPINREIFDVVRICTCFSDCLNAIKDIGIVFFEGFCALNLNILSECIVCSRSRLLIALRKAKWDVFETGNTYYRKELLKYVPESELKNWSLRNYPDDSQLMNYIRRFPAIFCTEECYLSKKKQEMMLSFQKDVYSFTFPQTLGDDYL